MVQIKKVHTSLTLGKWYKFDLCENIIHSEKPENNIRFIGSAEKVMLTKDYVARGKNNVARGVQAKNKAL